MGKVKKYAIVIAIILIIIFLDQIVKIIMTNQDSEIILFKEVLKLNYSENTGVAFGMINKNILKVIVADILVLGILIRFLIRQMDNMSVITKISISLIIAGGISNFIDRVIRGKVIDYIDISDLIKEFPIFNIADIFIILGFIIFVSTVFIELIKINSKK